MDLKELKKRIFEEEKIEELLSHLDCQNIKIEQNGDLFVAKLPEKFNPHNPRSVQVRNNEYLSSAIRTRNINGDIYSIVGYIIYDCTNFEETRVKIYDIACYICNALDYNIRDLQSEQRKNDWNYFLRPVQKDRKNEFRLDSIPQNNPVVIKGFIPELHKKWADEGVGVLTRDIFDVCYDIKYNRIVFPIHDMYGGIIGWKGRAIDDKDEYKYISYNRFHKSLELYNYHRAIEKIHSEKQVIILESEKSCMKCWQWGYKNCVAIMGSNLSPVQVAKLKGLGLDVEYVFMFDKDKDVEYVVSQVKQLKIRNVKIMIDRNDLLTDRDSPTDHGVGIFTWLLTDYIFPLKEIKNE